jgi:hypothetical protein
MRYKIYSINSSNPFINKHIDCSIEIISFEEALNEYQGYLPFITTVNIMVKLLLSMDRLCGLVIKVSDYSRRGPELDSRRCQIF